MFMNVVIVCKEAQTPSSPGIFRTFVESLYYLAFQLTLSHFPVPIPGNLTFQFHPLSFYVRQITGSIVMVKLVQNG